MDNFGVIERSSAGIKEIGVSSLELEKHIIWIQGKITDEVANTFIRQLAMIELDHSKKPVQIWISSTGGSILSGLLIYDAMKSCSLEIHTVVIESAYSMAAILAASGDKRYAFPHSKLMLHEPYIETNMSINRKNIESLSNSLNESYEKALEILSTQTKKNKNTIKKEISYDHYFSTEEAIDFGLIDETIGFSKLMENR